MMNERKQIRDHEIRQQLDLINLLQPPQLGDEGCEKGRWLRRIQLSKTALGLLESDGDHQQQVSAHHPIRNLERGAQEF